MFIDGRTIESKSQLDFDLCILGGGPAGITLAHKLRNSGFRIAIIESGDRYFDEVNQDLYAGQNMDSKYQDPSTSRIRALGGSTNHWEGTCNELDPIDFEKRSWVDDSGWPFKKNQFSSYYTSARNYCELPQQNYTPTDLSEVFRHPLLPADELVDSSVSLISPPTNFGDRWTEEFEESESVTVFLFSNAVELLSHGQEKEIRSAKIQVLDGDDFQVNARFFVVALGGLENARMLLHWNSQHDNQLGNQGDNVGRYFMDHPTVEAAFLAPTSALSKFEFYHPNANDDVQYFGYLELTEKALRDFETTNMKFPFIAADNYYLSPALMSAHTLADSIKSGHVPTHFFSHVRNVFADFDMILEASSRAAFDKQLFDHADEFGGYVFDSMIEQTPNRQSRVLLSPTANDALGVPRILIDWRLNESDKDRVWKSVELVGQYFGAQSLGRLNVRKNQPAHVWDLQMGFGSHHMGTTRMADDPSKGVVDANLKVFGAENLFVAGSSVFPTGGHVPPTLTIVALSLRLADHLETRLERT